MTELMAKYRLVFQSAIGQDVLADILGLTHFGQTLNPDNPAMIAEYNVGMAILAKMGVFSKGTKGDVVKALMVISPHKEEVK